MRVTGKSVRDQCPDGFNHLGGVLQPFLCVLVANALLATAGLMVLLIHVFCLFVYFVYFPKSRHSLSLKRAH